MLNIEIMSKFRSIKTEFFAIICVFMSGSVCAKCLKIKKKVEFIYIVEKHVQRTETSIQFDKGANVDISLYVVTSITQQSIHRII